jgi:hypothetical protein
LAYCSASIFTYGSLSRLKEFPTKPKIRHTRILGKKWHMQVVDGVEPVYEFYDGDKLVLTETCFELPPPPKIEGAEFIGPFHKVWKIAIGESTFTLQPDGTWLTESGQRLKYVFTQFEAYDEYDMAVYQLIAF